MKYWLLTTEYPPFFGGGISTYCSVTAQMLAEKGYEVSVFVNDPSTNDFKIDPTSVNLRVIRFNTSRTRSSGSLGHVTNLAYEFAHIVKHFVEKEGKPDFIEAQEYLGISYYILQYKYLLYDWATDIPVIITMHSPTFLYMEFNHVPLYRFPNYWICEMERFCLQAADLLISPSQFMLTELRKRFDLQNPNVKIIRNPFKPKTIPPAKEPGNHNNEIIFFGKLTVQKGALYLFRYFEELWENGFNRSLTVIGGPDIFYYAEKMSMGDLVRTRYKKFIDQGLLKLEDSLNPGNIAARLSGAEVIIVPSANDNLPYVVLEMMALGNIVLASKQGGQSEIIQDGIDGFIFDHEQPESFGEKLQAILKLNKEQRKLISQNAKGKVAGQFGTDEVYSQKNEALLQLTKKAGAPLKMPFIRALPSTPKENIIPVKKGKLSIVVTYYNSGVYIDDVMGCLEATDYPEKEILIVDDGSNDPLSREKLEVYRRKPGVKVITKKNKGLGDTRNVGANAADGEFLTFLDADDKVDASYYTKAIKVLQHYENVHFCGSWTQYFEGSASMWPAFTPEPPLILYHNLINSAALVYKRDTFLCAGQNDLEMTFQGLEDYDSVISLLEAGFRGIVIPDILFYYRVRPDSMIRGISKTKRLVISEYISHKHKNFYGIFAAEIFNLVNANGPGIEMDNPSLDHDLADEMPFGGKVSLKLIRLIKRNRLVKTIAYKAYRLLKK